MQEQREHQLYVRVMEAVRTGGHDCVLAAVVELHKPVPVRGSWHLWVCEGCDPGPFAEDAPLGPCTTLCEIAERLGVEL